MRTPPPTNDPNELLGAQMWLRGMWLGFGLLFLFIVGALLGYLLAGLIGWEGIGRGMIALLIGPIFGAIAFLILRGLLMGRGNA